MTAKKHSRKQEPLLNAVARRLGHAAGTIAKVTQEFTGNLSSLPDTVTAKMREAVNIGTSAEPESRRARPRKTSSAGRKDDKDKGKRTARRAVKRSPKSGKLPGRRSKSATSKK
jgi:hypothetical protein